MGTIGGQPYTGELAPWNEVGGQHEFPGLVLGNGVSRNIWEGFVYRSLYERATRVNVLTTEDVELFERLGADNFEVVLQKLSNAMEVDVAMGKAAADQQARYWSIQAALAKAVHSVHVPPALVPAETLEVINDVVLEHKHVFTTSYDLLLYWGMGCKDDFKPFLDFFWVDGDAFDEGTHSFTDMDTRTRVYFLHGALHLLKTSDGRARKRCVGMGPGPTLLDSFGAPYGHDDQTRPLIVTESDAPSKERSIADDDYLSYCWRSLRSCTSPLVVLGHSLSEQDQHLIDAINAHDRPVAVGLRPKNSRAEVKRQQLQIASRLAPITDLSFFNAFNHPLTDSDLKVTRGSMFVGATSF